MIVRLINYVIALVAGIIRGVIFFINVENYNSEVVFQGILSIFVYFLIGLLSFFICYWGFIVIVCLTASRKKKYNDFSKFYYSVMNSWYEYFLSLLGVRIKTSGLENINLNQRFLLICNHRSNFDNFVLSLVFRNERISFISKQENFNIPFAGRIANRVQYLAIPRGSHRGAFETILQAVEYINLNKASICVFPEGTRSKNREILKFKPGCLKIAEKSECPVVAVFMNGTERIVKYNPFTKRIVNVDFIKLYSSEEVKSLSTVEISDEIRNLMIEKLKEY